MRSKVLLYLMIFTLFMMATSIFAVVPSTTLQFEDQWRLSGHNFDPSTRSPAINASCVKCHDSDWYVKIQVNEEKPPEANLEKPAEYGHTCKTCHENENPTNILALRKVGDVTLPAYGDVVSAGISASCMSCHNGRRVNPEEYIKTNTRGTHEGPQADMLSGTGAITYGETFGSSAHTIVTTKGCLTCHFEGAPAEGEHGYNKVGGHTFKMYSDNGTPNNTKDDVENIGACQKCHKGFTTFDVTAKGDHDGNGKVEGIQTEVKGLLALIAAELPKNAAGAIAMPTNDAIAAMTPEDQVIAMNQRMANFNYALANLDGSFGIHNTAYAVQVLRTTYEKLTGETLAGDTIEASPLTASRPVTSDAIDKRFKQWEVSPHNFNPVEREPSEEAGCVKCHNSEWFVRIQVKGEAPPPENLPEPPSNGHTCATCHATDDPTNMLRLNLVGNVTLPAYGDVIDAGASATCMSCHNARRVNPEKYILTSFRGTHGGPQSDMLAGKSGISYGKTLESSSHFTAVEKKCVGCHMGDTPAKGKPGYNKIGDHTFRMFSDNGTPDDPKDDVENVSVCQQCHTGITTFDFTAKDDYDGNGKVEGVQTEVKGLLALIAAELPKNPETGAIAIPAGNIIPLGNANDIVPPLTPEQQDKLKAIRMANYNYTLVNNDGSYGVHNFRYAVDLLRTTYKQLTGKDVSAPAASDDNVYFTSLTQGLNMISVPLKPAVAYNARSLAEELSATVVIKYDETLGKFVGFALEAPGDGFAIDGGKGYIVNVSKAGTISFTGSAWTNNPPVAAPPTAQNNNAWAFLVSGSVIDGETISTRTGGYIVTVKNLGTGSVVTETLNNSGYFSVAWANLDRQAVIKSGDKVEISVSDTNGSIISGPFVYKINLDQIRDTLLKVQIKLGDIVPTNAALLQNYPNPFNPETWIPYYLKDADSVSIKIFNSAGQMIRTLDLGRKDAGVYVSRSNAAYWDGKNESGEIVSSGVYFYTITAGKFTATKKMVIRK